MRYDDGDSEDLYLVEDQQTNKSLLQVAMLNKMSVAQLRALPQNVSASSSSSAPNASFIYPEPAGAKRAAEPSIASMGRLPSGGEEAPEPGEAAGRRRRALRPRVALERRRARRKPII